VVFRAVSACVVPGAESELAAHLGVDARAVRRGRDAAAALASDRSLLLPTRSRARLNGKYSRSPDAVLLAIVSWWESLDGSWPSPNKGA